MQLLSRVANFIDLLFQVPAVVFDAEFVILFSKPIVINKPQIEGSI